MTYGKSNNPYLGMLGGILGGDPAQYQEGRFTNSNEQQQAALAALAARQNAYNKFRRDMAEQAQPEPAPEKWADAEDAEFVEIEPLQIGHD